MQPAPPDLRAIDEAAAQFFAAFDNRDGRSVDMAGLRELLMADARIVRIDGSGAEVMDPEGFIAPREALLLSGTLTDFHEWEERAETTVFGGLASRRCVYRKAGLRDGASIAGGGFKAMSFVKTDGGWRIASVVWQDAAPGLDLDGLRL